MIKGNSINFGQISVSLLGRSKTDSLVFSYDELLHLLEERTRDCGSIEYSPALKVIDSPSHPAATSNAPLHQHNMIPFEALSLSNGKNIEQFAELWRDEVETSMSRK